MCEDVCGGSLWSHQGEGEQCMPRGGGSSAIAEGLRKRWSLQCGKLTAQAMYSLWVAIFTLQTERVPLCHQTMELLGFL